MIEEKVVVEDKWLRQQAHKQQIMRMR